MATMKRFRRRDLRPYFPSKAIAQGGHDYGQYPRDAKNAGLHEVEFSFSKCYGLPNAPRCHEFWANLQGRPQPDPPRDKTSGVVKGPL